MLRRINPRCFLFPVKPLRSSRAVRPSINYHHSSSSSRKTPLEPAKRSRKSFRLCVAIIIIIVRSGFIAYLGSNKAGFPATNTQVFRCAAAGLYLHGAHARKSPARSIIESVVLCDVTCINKQQ